MEQVSVFNTRQRIFIWLFGILLCPMVAALAINLGLSRYENEFQTQANLIHDEINRRYSTLDAVLTSLAGFHQASDFVSDVQFSTFANELIRAYPYIRTAISLQKLQQSDRKNLVLEKHDQGYYQFDITELATDGRLTPAALRKQYLIINVMEPLPPQMGVLLGFDVLSNPVLADAIKTAIATGKGIASPITRILQNNGGIMIFKAVYQGRYAPTDVDERIAMFDGAIAIEVGAESLLSNLSAGYLPLDITIRQKSSSPEQQAEYSVHVRDSSESTSSGITDGKPTLFPAFTTQYYMNLYGQKTELTIKHQLTAANFYSTGALIAIVSCLLVYLALINAWRQRIMDRAHEQELAGYAARAAFSEENTDPILRINELGEVMYSNTPGLKILDAWNTTTGSQVPGGIHKFVGKALQSKTYQEIEVSTDNTHYTLRFVASKTHHYVNIYGRDDTEQIQYEKDLMAAKQQAEAASVAKSRFMATISHEVRTPLNGVLGMLDLLRTTKMDERQHKLTETASRSGKILLGLINDILDFSKLDSEKLQLDLVPFNLKDLIDDVVQIVAEPVRIKRLLFTVDVPDEDFKLIGDDKRLRQILINLVGNAVKFTDTGEITLQVKAFHLNDKYLKFSFIVQDTGVGIARDALPNIFDDFTQQDTSTTRQFGGTGLGLAITRQLVSLMNGEIDVTSEQGKGSVFTVQLNLQKQDQQLRQNNNIQEPATEFNSDMAIDAECKTGNLKINVLLAEDNEINQEVASAMLESFGYDVTVVENGLLAIEALKNSHYDLVLMDCQMPQMDGLQATREVRQLQAEVSHIPIIALTADVQEEAKKQCRNAGMNDYLSKPFSSTELQEIIEKWSA